MMTAGHDAVPESGPDIRLGLIGDNIASSRAPELHRLVGQQHRLVVTYDRLVPADLGQEFDSVFESCAQDQYRGLNITYPYKERAAAKVTVDDALVRGIGAINTVLFEADGPKGFNTDYSGFIAAYRGQRGATAPGTTCIIGTGGVGRAVAFGLLALGATELRLVDRDPAKAAALAVDLERTAPQLRVSVHGDGVEPAAGAEGLINCTPVGMVGYEGTPLPRSAMPGARWAFDAVYTPVDTQFLADAGTEGLTLISGYELFFHQGVHAARLFLGKPVDEARLRADLSQAENRRAR